MWKSAVTRITLYIYILEENFFKQNYILQNTFALHRVIV